MKASIRPQDLRSPERPPLLCFLWPHRRAHEWISAGLLLLLMVVSARQSGSGLGLVALGLVYVLFHLMRLSVAPSRLATGAAGAEPVRQVLEGLSCTRDTGLQAETWVFPAPSSVKLGDPRFRVTLQPDGAALIGAWVLLYRVSRRLRGTGMIGSAHEAL